MRTVRCDSTYADRLLRSMWVQVCTALCHRTSSSAQMSVSARIFAARPKQKPHFSSTVGGVSYSPAPLSVALYIAIWHNAPFRLSLLFINFHHLLEKHISSYTLLLYFIFSLVFLSFRAIIVRHLRRKAYFTSSLLFFIFIFTERNSILFVAHYIFGNEEQRTSEAKRQRQADRQVDTHF